MIARVRAPFSYSNDRFHAAVAALEAYSTYKHRERRITKEELNLRIKEVEAALGRTAPELREWVVEALQRADRHTLRSRLNLLLDEAEEIGEALTGSNRDRFVSAVIRSRNAYAHSAQIIGGLEGGSALHWTAQGLNWVLRYHTLIELGFDTSDASNRILQSSAFRQEAEHLREELKLSA